MKEERSGSWVLLHEKSVGGGERAGVGFDAAGDVFHSGGKLCVGGEHEDAAAERAGEIRAAGEEKQVRNSTRSTTPPT